MFEQEDIEKKPYLIPVNVASRFEFFTGFGWKEFRIVSTTLIIGAFIFWFTGLFKKTVPVEETRMFLVNQEFVEIPIIPDALRALIFIILPIIFSAVAVIKDPSTGMNPIGILKSLREFQKKQKRYHYKYRSGGTA